MIIFGEFTDKRKLQLIQVYIIVIVWEKLKGQTQLKKMRRCNQIIASIIIEIILIMQKMKNRKQVKQKRAVMC